MTRVSHGKGRASEVEGTASAKISRKMVLVVFQEQQEGLCGWNMVSEGHLMEEEMRGATQLQRAVSAMQAASRCVL